MIKILILSSCSKKKLINLNGQPNCNDLNSKNKREYWKQLLKEHSKSAEEMYLGSQANSIKKAVSILRENYEVHYYIISAGFGLIKSDTLIPPYDCSFAKKKFANIRESAKDLEIEEELGKVLENTYELIFLALGKSYLITVGNFNKFTKSANLIVHFSKEIKGSSDNYFYCDDSKIRKIGKEINRTFKKPIGATVAAKGDIFLNYALDITKQQVNIENYSFKEWWEEQIDRIDKLKKEESNIINVLP